MQIWKQILLSTYYHATWPLRYTRNRIMAVAGRAPVVVLMYHRVANDAANPWTTHNDVFVRQIRWLQKRFEFVSLAEVQRRIREPHNYRPAVAITFDDGYAANFDRALPLLLDQGTPFTYFVTSRPVLRRQYFPHDLEMGNRLETNSLDQLKSLANAGVEIGAHSRTHANLSTISDPDQLHDEIANSGRELEDALGQRVRYFAFPYGQHAHLTTAGFQVAERAGYEAVVSAYGGYNFPGDDAFHLQRLGVDGPMIRMKNCTTLDPYKQWKIDRFQYRSSTNTASAAACADHDCQLDTSGMNYAP